MTISIDVQYAVNDASIPDENKINTWVRATLENLRDKAELTVRIVGEEEGRQLNEQWRHLDGPTNVLSFTAEGLDDIKPDLLGDIVICAPVVNREADEQHKTKESHWAHMVIHGTLHLVGYDHGNDHEAEEMEATEIALLEKLGYSNPYT